MVGPWGVRGIRAFRSSRQGIDEEIVGDSYQAVVIDPLYQSPRPLLLASTILYKTYKLSLPDCKDRQLAVTIRIFQIEKKMFVASCS